MPFLLTYTFLSGTPFASAPCSASFNLSFIGPIGALAVPLQCLCRAPCSADAYTSCLCSLQCLCSEPNSPPPNATSSNLSFSGPISALEVPLQCPWKTLCIALAYAPCLCYLQCLWSEPCSPPPMLLLVSHSIFDSVVPSVLLQCPLDCLQNPFQCPRLYLIPMHLAMPLLWTLQCSPNVASSVPFNFSFSGPISALAVPLAVPFTMSHACVPCSLNPNAVSSAHSLLLLVAPPVLL